MKSAKGIPYMVGISFIILMLSYIFIAKAISENNPRILIRLFQLIFFVFSGYWRLFQYYRLLKLNGQTQEKDFLSFFDNMGVISLAIHIFIPFPVRKKFSNLEENKIRTRINIWTAVTWVNYVLLGCFGFM